MRRLLFVALLVPTPASVAQQRAEIPSVPHVICSAFSSMAAAVMHGERMLDGADKLGYWAERHAWAAIELDQLDGLPAWATRDLITQLTRKLKERANTQNEFMALSQKHGDQCAALARRMPEIELEIAARKKALRR